MFDVLLFHAVSLSPSYQRSLFVSSTAMVIFAAKLYHVADANNLLNLLFESDVSMKSLCIHVLLMYIVLFWLCYSSNIASTKLRYNAYNLGRSISWHQ